MKFLLYTKAIFTRVLFSAHGFVAVWRVTSVKQDPIYWYLSAAIFVLVLESIFTLTLKKNQEWTWFCPSVFFYLGSVVPSIWLLEFDKLDRRRAFLALATGLANETSLSFNPINATAKDFGNSLTDIEELGSIQTFGIQLKIPVQLSAETWATVIEQLLMLILIVGRWFLPKGALTREQLSQLLLVYIGTAADIIEFFDAFKDEKIATNDVLVYLILSIWTWSLLQFWENPENVTRTRTVKKICCSLDVWSVLINIILQDAPFLVFRLLLIFYYNLVTYMNIFFTAKNTLVIVLQFYRLIVVQTEKRKQLRQEKLENLRKGRHRSRHHNHGRKQEKDSDRRHRPSAKHDSGRKSSPSRYSSRSVDDISVNSESSGKRERGRPRSPSPSPSPKKHRAKLIRESERERITSRSPPRDRRESRLRSSNSASQSSIHKAQSTMTNREDLGMGFPQLVLAEAVRRSRIKLEDVEV
ncbi:unnamed protein product [Darwinula stevensoni]|uniref:Transmembrane protein 26 n=1 Tax=Darwinula stevensoni TaxID=69355 RepID=A0A7R8X8P0_9CRUS|nr:unnamed protein product [Darwinula stevensoni]CAG0881726.1 unnamed protein product [Darwinula stevensoni]